MDHGQDEDVLWRRAFADSSGLFDNSNIPTSFGLLLGDTSAATLTCPTPSIPILPDNITTEPLLAIRSSPAPLPPALDFISAQPLPPPQQTTILPCPPSLPSTSSAPPITPQLPAKQQQLVIPSNVGVPATHNWLITSAHNSVSALGGASIVAAAPPSAVSANAAAAAAAILRASEADDFQDCASQQRGDSCARKRDRAKLLRQQMNDGLDGLHEALVEISTSGANPSAAATTGLIPTRGPRRAAVVACSAGLVRDLIATCVTLRTESITLSDRLAAATLALQSSPGAQALLAGGLSAGAVAAVATAVATIDRGATGGRAGVRELAREAGVGAAIVFGQLLSLHIFGFLGPQSLEEGKTVCRSWRDKCTWDCCWSNLCVSRWRLCPEERHAEVWRTSKANASVAILSPPTPPPSWRQVYRRLHTELRVPTGALLPVHLVIGRSVQEGVAVWIALSRRSNGMTGRSVMGATGIRTTEVVELRAVIQRVDEGPAIVVHPRFFLVRRLPTGRAGNFQGTNGGGASSPPYPCVFPPISDGQGRFAPRVAVNARLDGSDDAKLGGSGGIGMRREVTSGPAALALNEYATVDFFIETSGCPTERDFLRQATRIDVGVSKKQAGVARGIAGATVLAVALDEREHEPCVFGGNVNFNKGWRPSKRRGSST